MAILRPLVLISGEYSELPPGDTPSDLSVGALAVTSGLAGGGDLSSAARVDVALAPEASGLIFVSNKLADDGVAQRLAEAALASGEIASVYSSQALASGVESVSISIQALATGVAVQQNIENITVGLATYTAATALASGDPVGVNELGLVQLVANQKNPLNISNIGTYQPFSSGQASEYNGMSYDTHNDRYLVSFRDGRLSSNRLGLRAFSISGSSNTITFGEFDVPDTANQVGESFCVFDPSSSGHLVLYRDVTNSNYLTEVVATIDPTTNTVTSTSPDVVLSSDISRFTAAYNPNEEQLNIVYSSLGLSYSFSAEISGTQPTFGTPTVFDAFNFNDGAYIHANPVNNKVVSFYTANSNLRAQVFDPSGLYLIPDGPVRVLTPLGTEWNSSASTASYDSDNDLYLVTYIASDDYTKLYGTYVQFSGDVLTYEQGRGFITGLEDTQGGVIAAAYNPDLKVHTIASEVTDSGVLYTQVTKTPSGYVSPSFFVTSGYSPRASNMNYPNLIYDTTRSLYVLQAYAADSISSGVIQLLEHGESIFPTYSGYQNNFIGISQENVVSGQSVVVRYPGSLDSSIGTVSAGSNYYLDPLNSGISNTVYDAPASWSGAWGPIGKAVSNNQILLTDNL